jgi:predicted nucleotidyltransferase
MKQRRAGKSQFEKTHFPSDVLIEDIFNSPDTTRGMMLFGSVPRGQAKEHSDIDIMVVASGLPD